MLRHLRPNIARMAGYAPGEQPQGPGYIKLNTNENPYPPSPRALAAIVAAANDRLRLYPDPLATELRQAAARLHGVRPEMVLAGNGSDDVLTIVTRAFVGPGERAAFATPSYLLYSTLLELQAAQAVVVPYAPDWTLDRGKFRVPGLKLVYLANPDSPSGTAMTGAEIAELANGLDCPVLVDEAYADFADPAHHGAPYLDRCPNLMISRTLSKGHSLAGARVGYLLASSETIEQLNKVKDSYNCDRLSQAAGAAALLDREHLAQTRAKVIATRQRLAAALRGMGHQVPESQANFVWAEGGPPARPIFQALKDRKILVRLMAYPNRAEGLRISVGTDEEIDRFLEVMREIVESRVTTQQCEQ